MFTIFIEKKEVKSDISVNIGTATYLRWISGKLTLIFDFGNPRRPPDVIFRTLKKRPLPPPQPIQYTRIEKHVCRPKITFYLHIRIVSVSVMQLKKSCLFCLRYVNIPYRKLWWLLDIYSKRNLTNWNCASHLVIVIIFFQLLFKITTTFFSSLW